MAKKKIETSVETKTSVNLTAEEVEEILLDHFKECVPETEKSSYEIEWDERSEGGIDGVTITKIERKFSEKLL